MRVVMFEAFIRSVRERISITLLNIFILSSLTGMANNLYNFCYLSTGTCVPIIFSNLSSKLVTNSYTVGRTVSFTFIPRDFKYVIR